MSIKILFKIMENDRENTYQNFKQQILNELINT